MKTSGPQAFEDGHRVLIRGMHLSISVGVVLLVVKVAAAWLTGSTAALSDAAESVVHVFVVGFAAYAVRLADKPADELHQYGHDKVSFISAGFEGAMIVMVALFIIYEALTRWAGGIEIQRLDLGIGLLGFAAVVNAFVGLYLVRLGRRERSLVLEANGKHLWADVLTSIGVVVGLGLVRLTGATFWDPVCALGMAAVALVSGMRLARLSLGGLMDTADPGVHAQLEEVIRRAAAAQGAHFHQLRHRNAGRRLWVDVHLTFQDEMSVREAHQRATEIERALGREIDRDIQVTTHLEPREHHDVIHEK